MGSKTSSGKDKRYFQNLLPEGVLSPRSELIKLSLAIDKLIRRTDDHTEHQCKVRRPATEKSWRETVALVHNALAG